MANSAEVEEFSKNFDEGFCFIACMASTTASDIWYIESGAYCHMTGHKRFFKSLLEGGVNIHIELGDDARYQAQWVGKVSFQREFGKPLNFANILYVSGLRKNLISIYTWRTRAFRWSSKIIGCISGQRGQIGVWIGWLGSGARRCIDYTLSLQRL